MDFLLSDELREFRSVLRRFFAAEFPLEDLQQRLSTGEEAAAALSAIDPQRTADVRKRLADMGAFAGSVPETCGGLGLGLGAGQILVEESARTLAPLPLFETTAFGVVPLLALGAGDFRDELLGKIAAGELFVSGTFPHYPHGTAVPDPGCMLSRESSGSNDADWPECVSGEALLVPSCDRVHLLFLAGEEQGGQSEGRQLFAVPLAGQVRDALALEPVETLDLFRPFFRLTCKRAKARLLGASEVGAKNWIDHYRRIELLSAAELYSVAERVFASTVEYVKTRKQFGVPVGSFQAVQHALADLHVCLEETGSLCRAACWSAENDPAQFNSSAQTARAYAAEHMPRVVEKCLQLHGGIAFSWEFELHAYLRRALTTAGIFGGLQPSYEALARTVLVAPYS